MEGGCSLCVLGNITADILEEDKLWPPLDMATFGHGLELTQPNS